MPVPARILELTDRFDYNLDSYKSGKYNETQVRLEYINPLMEELVVDGITEFDDSEYLNYVGDITGQPIGLKFCFTCTQKENVKF
ncbi:MAG: hypothetical protein H8E19_09535 [Deltaproteobacteria bacterium]|uniref:Uncharacterized protein n=1 Tax=Candidatus Desulfacyla euxinica TaxID=2841693 RepID=A0A8J6N0B4_9DELT|nr:hypothetical protein [Candidatus Desulfacyla euxinica]MBL7218137.1 hypothetical protein [Desulfobacteraceae bacterium]